MAIFGIFSTVDQGLVWSGGHWRYGHGHTCKYSDKGRNEGCTQHMKTPAIFIWSLKVLFDGLTCGRFQISIILIVAREGGIPLDDFYEHLLGWVVVSRCAIWSDCRVEVATLGHTMGGHWALGSSLSPGQQRDWGGHTGHRHVAVCPLVSRHASHNINITPIT